MKNNNNKISLFSLIKLAFIGLMTSTTLNAKILDFGPNVLTADPSGHVWKDGRMYVYVSHDLECQEDFHMKDWLVYSSDDLKQWTNHGPFMSLDDFSWADNYAWAPDAAYKNGKYYAVLPVGTGFKDRINPEKSTKWMGLGMAVSDSPTGPFKDAIGKPLWTKPYTNDPSLFIDDDGQAYLYFHAKGYDYHVVKMNDDLLSVDGKFIKMDMGGYTPKMEGPWVFKRGDNYYFTMPENNRVLTYYMAKSPTGPWEYKGTFMDQEHNANNHHSIVQFKGQWVLFYHRWINVPGSSCHKRQRVTAMEPITFNADGTINKVQRTD
ncbi:family 43 glycosylhydrolase [Psychrosphaera sp. 1_MG-2023]|uniref:family 43 glycosylhydrolase n=1 Tax=Psychrosphaera sp. 1_MG-2023 TaxID=3062643 RepID=UPI0026E2B359|nr:family 43 glycosylhydrolase [Psychrosphaera sp. 1_MG-2023]MDO6718776.1 family 43 glycosylhydrolase [Psychrosphaera sp. 1_MG-2023]